MSRFGAAAYACLTVLLLAACSSAPMREDVIAQARPGGRVAFDVVKLDDAVLTTLLAQPHASFREQFKKYVPPPDLKIAVGDTVSVVIWEAAANGLFGNSLTELSFPAGASASLLTEKPTPLGGVPSTPQGLAASPDLLAKLLGVTPEGNETAPAESTGVAPPRRAPAPDRLQQLLDTATQSGRPGTQIPDQQVGSDGGISVPYAGRIRVAGRTPEEAERDIEKRLGPVALEPQALVVVNRSAANAVSVAGEVIRGARVPLSPGGTRLLQVVAAAGGARSPVHDTFLRLTRGGVTATVPLATLVADPDQDIFAKPGDVLTLVKRQQTLSVFGATGSNTAITFTSDRMSLGEALGKAGGLLDERADPRAVFLFRYEPLYVVRALGQPVASDARNGVSPIVYRLDLSDAKSYLLARRLPVRDKDIIFVAEAETQPIYRFFRSLQQVTGAVVTGLVACQYAKC